MKRFNPQHTPIDGLYVIERKKNGDDRGFLSRLFDPEELSAYSWSGMVAQINHTRTEKKGTVRGMHYQLPPFAEVKLVTCIRGAVFDVAVDLRQGSPTFLNWYSVILDGEVARSFMIPAGFAHGFQTMTDDVEMIYVHSQAYAPDDERGLAPGDRKLNIAWPLPIASLSERDRSFPPIDSAFKGVVL